jgi:hypothetical protein
MGDPARKKTFEEELQDALGNAPSSDSGGAPSFDDELQQALAPSPRSSDAIGHGESMPVQQIEGDTPDVIQQALDLLRDHPQNPNDPALRLGPMGMMLGGAPAMANEAAPLAARAVQDGGGALLKILRGAGGIAKSTAEGGVYGGANVSVAAQDRGADPDAVLAEMINGAGQGAALGGGASVLGAAASGVGKGLDAVAARARSASLGATGKDLQKLGMTPAELAAVSDRLGVNNRVLPMSTAQKLARVQGAGETAGQSIGNAIGAADEAGVGQHRDWGGEVARDLYQQADDKMLGQLGDDPRRGAALSEVARGAGNQDVGSLEQLRQLKTGYEKAAYTNSLGGTDESMMGEAHRAAADSARGYLHGAMRQAGPELNQPFMQGNQDFGDSKMLEELLQNKQARDITNSGFGLNRRTVGDAVGAGVGAAMGGPAGAIAGVGVNELTRPFQADALANMSSLGAGASSGLGAGMQGSAGAIGGTSQGVDDPRAQMQQTIEQGRGDLLPDVVGQVLLKNPSMLGKYSAELADAKADGTLPGVIMRLKRTDPEFTKTVLPMLQQMTSDNREE